MTEADRLLQRALHDYEADLCACGHPRSEAWSPDNDRANPDHTGHYEAGAPYRCFACTVKLRAQRRYGEMFGQDINDGAYWVAEWLPRGKTLAAL